MTPQPAPPTNANTITLLSGPLTEFTKYSRNEQSNWLMDIAHDICDLAAMRGSLFVWKLDTMQWFPVTPTDPLIASVYTYRLPAGVVVGLSKISGRNNKSRTSATGDASTMAGRVKRRDGVCWATGVRRLMNSHVCPKRMGDHLARIIYIISFGLTFSKTLNAYFDVYKLGLRAVGVNQYQCHVFMDDTPGWVFTISGEMRAPTMLPALHGLNASPPQPHHTNNPPPGLLRWHYLQCVLDKFGHADYKTLPNIRYSELPFRAYGDSDDEGTDSEADWPSAIFDRARALKATLEDDAQQNRDVASWVESVF
ncbi:hypothetical protein K438DRAFT_1919258 [Mycena galopus ATCC 62051]|nr:hypothetical protein K438DRAFT_1919258 [Mycena galopus ATCC 62051]